MVALNRFFSRFSWDVVGFSASAICAVHCLAVPFILMISSFSGSGFLHNHHLETFILMFSTAVGLISILPGWRKHHKKPLPFVIFLAGISFIALGRLHLPLLVETIFTTGGAAIVASAHWVNWRLCRPFHAESASKSS